MEQETLLQAQDLTKYFPVTKGLVLQKTVGWVQAVDHVNFTIPRGKTLSLVGESGCGKTTTAKLILRLEQPTTGQITLDGNDVHTIEGDELKQYHTDVSAVFQDPWSSLSPRMRVRDIISEALVVNQKVTKTEAYDRVDELLVQVGLRAQQATLYPHEFSGGQRQRLALAAALVGNPKLIVLDEPVSALDVSIQAQIMNLLKELQDSYEVGFLLVAHNLATVRYLAHEVAVMYLGEIVEQAETDELYDNTLHPYTKALFSAALTANPDSQREEIILRGEVPSPINPPSGCRFHQRCPYAMDVCSQEIPVRKEMAPGHFVNCHLY
ncbi:MAG: oligopeptide/dipeptide ABC transporter ATP-binding protein [Chloroflexota bacterium]|nr:oligopeptide/dipeptide ABC transporter ATP-binding protein [Chloroflexota bacterium]